MTIKKKNPVLFRDSSGREITAEDALRRDIANILKKLKAGKSISTSERNFLTSNKIDTSTSNEASASRKLDFARRHRDLHRAMVGAGVVMRKDGLPRIGSASRKKRASKNLEVFCRIYQPETFSEKMSPGQKKDLETMQRVCVGSGRFAFAAPRGDGKTSRVEAAILWAALYGHKKCIVLVGADLTAALEILASIKQEIRTNELLLADFPIPCWAAFLSDDAALRAKGWTWQNKKLEVEWGKQRIILPVMEGADGSGCIITARGLTGRLRGMRLKIGKKAVRPDMFAVDDPQTDESAASASQCDSREKLMLGAIMGSGGPKKNIACFMPCTIIEHDDLAARFLDKKRHPDWQGRTRSMVIKWPKNQKTMWREYMRLRREESQADANKYYTHNRSAMDKGAVVDWDQRYTPGEKSALQHAENLLCDLGEMVFAAEYQNDPREAKPSIYDLKPAIIEGRIHHGREPWQIPAESKLIVTGTDLNHYGLHSTTISFANDLTGWVADYGRYDNKGHGVVPKNCPEPEAKRMMFEALVKHGESLAAIPLMRGSESMRAGLWLIDAGYMPDIVRRYIEGPGRTVGFPVLAARGYGYARYRPGGKAMIGRPRECCHLTESVVVGRFLAFQADYWREISQRAWLAEPNAPGSLSLPEGRNHREFAQHICREKLIEKVKGNTGFLWRWHTAPGWHDWGDCATMCYVGAAWGGIGTAGVMPQRQRRRRKTRLTKIAI